jgi:Leucine-rich repeat (LRR) protein
MKNLIKIIVLLFVVNTVNAQIVSIPDEAFKVKLISLGIDTNSDGEIQQSEANLVSDILDLSSSNISDITGINSFINISKLKCNDNLLTNVSINLLNLTEINLYNNLISSFNLINANNLTSLVISKNQLTSLDLSNLSSLTNLSCGQNQLSTLDCSALVNLLYLDCSLNSSTTLDVTNLTNLKFLAFYGNQLITNFSPNNLVNLEVLQIANCNITTLDLSSLINLKEIKIFSTELDNINLSNLINLKSLSIPSNKLTALNLTGLVNLKYLYCAYNLFTTLNVSSLTSLEDIRYGNVNQDILDVSNLTNLKTIAYYLGNQLPVGIENLPNLNEFQVNETAFTSLDISNLLFLTTFWARNNLALNYINLKNGSEYGIPNILIGENHPNLNFVCANDIDIQRVISGNYSGNVTIQVNSYCSFTPGGNFNTITGTMLFDANNNGCDTNDLPQPNIKININDGTNQGGTYSNSLGNYNFYTQAGSFYLTPNVENASFFTFSPTTATIPFSNNLNNTSIQNFCISANGIHPDVEVALMPISPARPGFDVPYKIVFKNKGNQMVSGTINLAFNDDKTDFVSSTPTVNTQSTNSLTWNYINLMPFESRSITFSLNINSPVETPAVNIGDILNFVTTINPLTDDIPADNTYNYDQTVVGSFDPNSIECLEGESVDPSYIGQYLHYGVNFENTGNYPAENIVVKVIIDTTKYDMNSLQLMDTSHNSYTRITGNVAEFIFETINLDSGGHGNILFKIKTLNELSSGDMVNKRADIFFDYNAPIDTGMANTTFQTLSNGNFEIDDSISVYPNPTKSNININCQNTIKSIQLYDVQGRLLETKLVEDLQASIDISEKLKGIYFLKITSDNGSKVVKVVKE